MMHIAKRTRDSQKEKNKIITLMTELCATAFAFRVLDSVSHCHDLLANLNRKEHFSMLLVTLALFLQRQVKLSSVKEKKPKNYDAVLWVSWVSAVHSDMAPRTAEWRGFHILKTFHIRWHAHMQYCAYYVYGRQRAASCSQAQQNRKQNRKI